MTRDPAEFGWHCWSNTAHPPPSFHNLRRFIGCRLPYCPYHRAASTRQPRGNSRCQSELRHNHSPLIPIPSTLTCLLYIHPPIIQGSLYSIHPPKPRPPSGISPVNFCINALSITLPFATLIHVYLYYLFLLKKKLFPITNSCSTHTI